MYKLSHTLSNGRTLIEDMRLRPQEGVNATLRMRAAWQGVRAPLSAAAMGSVWDSVDRELALFVSQARVQEQRLQVALRKLAPLKSDDPGVKKTMRMPAFSWETLPVAWHSGNSSGRYTDEQIKELARYSMVSDLPCNVRRGGG